MDEEVELSQPPNAAVPLGPLEVAALEGLLPVLLEDMRERGLLREVA
jgi:hypothetical protein